MLLFSALVGGSFSLGGQVAGEIAPAALNALRFALASLIVGVAVVATTGLRAQNFHAPWRFMVMGSIFAGYFLLMFYGLQRASAVSTSAVYTLTPVMAAGFGWLLLRQVTTLHMGMALLIGALGALIVIFRADWQAFVQLAVGPGEAIFFIGCVAHAFYTPLVRKLNRGEPAASFTLGMLLAGTGVLTLFGWSDIRATDWSNLRPLVWITIAYLAVFASAATFVLLQFATMRLPSAKVMAYTYLVPSWVILWDLAVGIAPPGGWVFAGPVLSALALLLLLRGERRHESDI
ncbi:EamA family transporter [Epibacterium sp. SM1979]|uniref:EamA family transporter n=1 Tax=Tritonibacter litoralis TaxID=2662264 RepID=A0A843YGR5_9RHOB|nr:DMT family transporter [Tritonibacter litoralis]MQQ08634.1 EamA family transporter [Tritonibacter litoralis]